MKKIYFALVLLATSLSAGFATDYFVDPLSGSNTNDGLSWATALRTLTAVDTKMANDGANANNVFVKGGTLVIASQWGPKFQNYYFSCVGTEVDPSQRTLEDKDGNGTIEPWEFSNPTLLSFSLSSGYPINFAIGSSTIIDGAMVTNNGSTVNSYLSVVKWVTATSANPTVNTAIFQNSIIKNCNLNYGDQTVAFPTTAGRQNYGCLLNVADNGMVKNCLIEKNNIIIKSQNVIIVPVASLTLSTISDVTPKISNVIVRNNYSSIELKSTEATPLTSSNRVQGLVFGVASGNATYSTSEGIFTNCLVYNNEFSYSGPTGFTQAVNASLAGSCYLMNGRATYQNCLFANNKLTNLGAGMYLYATPNYKYTVNNCVLWNNLNTVADSTFNVGMSVSDTLSVTTVVSHNVVDVDRQGPWGPEVDYSNNLVNLAQTNNGINAPYFSYPTAFIGINRTAGSTDSVAIAQANWRLMGGSYLIGKGIAYAAIDADLAGISYAANPAAGVYEHIITGLKDTDENLEFGKFSENRFVSSGLQSVYVFNITGSLLINTTLKEGEEIQFPKGVSIFKITSDKGTLIRKVLN